MSLKTRLEVILIFEMLKTLSRITLKHIFKSNLFLKLIEINLNLMLKLH